MATTYNQETNNSWKVNLDVFSGPLDLLLHLINELEIDIYDIPITEITTQYLAYLEQSNMLALDVGGEYLVMAATLMAIKSQLLVPRNESLADEEEMWYEGEDPREHLMELLLEYRKFKLVAQNLQEREEARSAFITKEESDVTKYQEHIPLKAGEISLEDLRTAFTRLLNERALQDPPPTIIERKQVSVSDKMKEIATKLREADSPMTFSYLMEGVLRTELVASFLAILELIKTQTIKANQSDVYGEITLRYIQKR
ncbi:segregation/condensation protein A [Dolosigranulum pigrum]|uniref:segregation and condensation protein A n=1 Tax=Dolosigranulum pigrum TaxID=29394 RepID=UPI001AD89CB6|nr:segregation/condensation protein A [Dolosigranulum pigrum]QTJ40036.1 segregation/condensation protein A [Dolosigranulum pigrum]QTJ48519.1 segregation/condensation protein A [Dolosigranulum pigrum]